MLKKKTDDEHDSTELNHALAVEHQQAIPGLSNA